MNDIRSRFPILAERPKLVYLDSAATALKPASVIDAVSAYYRDLSANVGRGLYATAEETTTRFEAVREKAARFLGADPNEIVFTRNSTEGINLLASVLEDCIKPGDNIVVTMLEHHSNFLPWKRLANGRGVELRVIPFGEDGSIDLKRLHEHIDRRTKVFAFTAISNVFGTMIPVADLVRTAKTINPDALTIVDAAQAVGHTVVDVRQLGCDFLAFSGHKMFGPTGVGVLFGKRDLLTALPPYQVGGGMVLDSTADDPVYMDAPHRFEAGTPDIAAVLGFGSAIDLVEEIGVDAIRAHETALATKAVTALRETFGDSIRILGTTDARQSGIVSFVIDGIHPHDIAQVLGDRNVCIRAGEHCATPLHRTLGLSATARASFSVYNTEADIDCLIEGLREVKSLFENNGSPTPQS